MVIADVTAAARSFIKRVRLHPQIFGQFRRVMSAYSSHKLDVRGVISELDTLFQFHHDLLTGYRFFLPPQFRASSSLQPRQSRKNNVVNLDIITLLNPCIHFMNKMQKRFADERGVILAYLESIRALTRGKLSNKKAYKAIARIFGNENQDLVDEFELLLVGDNGGPKRFKKKKTEEDKFKKDEKTNLSRDSGDEIKARKKKTLHGLNLCKRMEDEMFELDMRLSLLSTTVESAKAMKKMLEDSAAVQQHQIINIDQHFSAASLRFIRKEYKEQGLFIIEKLREDPKHVLFRILEELEPKEVELVKTREKLHKHWYEVHKKKQNAVTNSL